MRPHTCKDDIQNTYKWYGYLHQYMHQHLRGKLKCIPLCPLDKLFMIKLLNTLIDDVALTVDFH